MKPPAGATYAALSAVAFGSLGVFTKLAYADGWNVPSLLAFRFALAALCILPFALRAGGAWKGFAGALVLGAVGYTATTAFYFPSIRLLPAAVAAFLLYLAPGIVAIAAYVLWRERLRWLGVAAVVLALGGLGLLALGALTGELSPLGVLLAAASAVAYAASILGGRHVAQSIHWSRVALGVAIGACASYAVFGAATGTLQVPPGARPWLWVVGIGAVATGTALPLFYAALSKSSASEVAVISTLEPVSTLALAAVFLGEIPTWTGIAGGALILVAAAIMGSQQPQTAPHE